MHPHLKLLRRHFKLTLNGLEPAWYEALKSEENKSYFKGITSYLEKKTVRNKVFPPPNDIFAAFNSCPLDKVRVVIIGQDPYHGTSGKHITYVSRSKKELKHHLAYEIFIKNYIMMLAHR